MRRRTIVVALLITALALAGAAALWQIAAPLPSRTSSDLHSSPVAAADASTVNSRKPDGCARVAAAMWHPLSGVEYTGRLRIDLPAHPGGSIVLYVGDEIPLEVDVESIEGRPVAFRHQRITSGPGVHLPPDFWLEDNGPVHAPREVSRIEIEARPERALALRVWLGRRAPRVLARLMAYPPAARAIACAIPTVAGDTYFASGWYGEEEWNGHRVRWMGAYGAVLLGSSHGDATRVTIAAEPAVVPDDQTDIMLSMRVNGVFDAATVQMRPGLHTYQWDIPAPAWVEGTNELFFRVSQTRSQGRRVLGVALATLTAR
jgi:hypothetical protein